MAFVSLMLGMALVLRASPDPDGGPAARALIEAERAFAADADRLGTAAAFLAWSEPDALILTAHGEASVREVFVSAERRDDDVRLVWWPTWITLSRDGSVGVSSGPFERDGRRAGYFLTLWRRQADGSWRWFFDGGSPADAHPAPDADVPPRFVSPATTEDRPPTITAAELQIAEAVFAAEARMDQGAAHRAAVSAEARVIAASLPPMDGVAALAPRTASLGARLDFAPPDHLEIASGGDLGWVRGGLDGGEGRLGFYLRVWRREEGGWKIVYEQISEY